MTSRPPPKTPSELAKWCKQREIEIERASVDIDLHAWQSYWRWATKVGLHQDEIAVFSWDVLSQANKKIRQFCSDYLASLGLLGSALEGWTQNGVAILAPHRSGPSDLLPDAVFLGHLRKLSFSRTSRGWIAELESPAYMKLKILLFKDSYLLQDIYTVVTGVKTTIARGVIEQADRVLLLDITDIDDKE